MGIPDHVTCFLRNLYVGQEATVRTGHGTTDWEKEYVMAVYCHPAHLTYIQSTSCETLGWMKHKLESRELSNNLRYADDTTLMAESAEELKSHSMEVNAENEKVGLKLNIQKLRS